MRALFLALIWSGLAHGAGTCNVHLWSPISVAGGRCHYGDVMVGIRTVDPLVILCSHMTVTCSRASGESGTELPGEALEQAVQADGDTGARGKAPVERRD